jgi:chaperonin GroEL
MLYLQDKSVPVEGDMLKQVAYISCNNDKELGDKIGEAFEKVGHNGVVLMEDSDTNETYVDFVEGTQFESGLKSPHLITDKDKGTAVLDNPYVLIVSSPIPNIRRIQGILEHIVKTKRSLLIIASVEQQPYATLLANKVKGNIKVNIVDLPGFGPTKQDSIEDLAF